MPAGRQYHLGVGARATDRLDCTRGRIERLGIDRDPYHQRILTLYQFSKILVVNLSRVRIDDLDPDVCFFETCSKQQ